jgi:predicted RNA-binding Zn ribbon-like protein
VEFRTGYGADWLDLLMTRIGRYRERQTEMLGDPAALRQWLADHDLLPAGRITAEDVARTRDIREALHGLAAATVAGRRPSVADVQLVQAALAADHPPNLRATGTGVRVQRPADVDEALARLARRAVDQLVGPERDRLRPCGDETCAGIFLDETGRRHWCADERCGVRARVRAHRARSRQQVATTRVE